MHYYRAFMLSIQSDIELPELQPCLPSTFVNENSVTINIGHINSTGLDKRYFKSNFYQIAENEVWVSVENVARFLIRGGNQIIINPVSPIDEDAIRLVILSACMGALLMQRGLFLLHGNTIKMDNHCITFAGNSGTGKSTLTAGFVQRKHFLIADDVCAIQSNLSVLPGFAQLKLWNDTLKQLNIHASGLRCVRPGFEKYALPMTHQFYDQPLTLKIIYILKTHEHDHFQVTQLQGIEKLQALQANIYRKYYATPLIQNRYAKQSMQLAQKV